MFDELCDRKAIKKTRNFIRIMLVCFFQGPRLMAALEMTKPSAKPGSARTKGEDVIAEDDRIAREHSRPGGGAVMATVPVQRAVGKRKTCVPVGGYGS